ncbi:MAG: helix-turn-helix domain-containing protein [Clostridia bacterium]|nr:helix-turn-helix domain-containing protein [Clostridia bacterium]
MNNNSQKYYKSIFKDYPDVVNVKQLQTMLGGISKKLAYNLLKNNFINSIKIGRQYKIAKADVILYLTQNNSS